MGNGNCPGITSELAGKSDTCKGCPNQKFCESSPSSQDTQHLQQIKKNLSSIRTKILIFSGKGGVGKSFLTCSIAGTLSSMHHSDSDKEISVGILDLDLCGPSVPLMMGISGEKLYQDSTGISPIFSTNNSIPIASLSCLSEESLPIIWRGNKKANFIKDLLSSLIWDELDFLLIDTPPGTSDEHISIVNFMKEEIDGVIVITTPQELSWQDVKKEIDFCRKSGIPLIGLVLNMFCFCCPCCSSEVNILPNKTKEIEEYCSLNNIPILSKVPLDKEIARMCDNGEIKDNLDFIIPIASHLKNKYLRD